MTAIGGAVESITIRGRILAVAADADVNFDPGIDDNKVELNGNRTGRIIKSPKPWSIDGANVEIDHDRADLEFLQSIANGNSYETITITFASGSVWQGRGQLTGGVKGSSQNATAAIAIMGQGTATQQ